MIWLILFAVCMLFWLLACLYRPNPVPVWYAPGGNLIAWLAVLFLALHLGIRL